MNRKNHVYVYVFSMIFFSYLVGTAIMLHDETGNSIIYYLSLEFAVVGVALGGFFLTRPKK